MSYIRHLYKNGASLRLQYPARFSHAQQLKEDVRRREISKVLIANRGEIACRVMKTARKLGVRTVAVYSDADKHAMHVEMADEAYHIGPAPSTQSYLNAAKILEVAKKSNSQAIHPGYGFLSENVEFCEKCASEDVIFIGPPPAAIRDMGIKSTSKAIMSAAGVPIVKGYHGEDQSIEKLQAEAQRIGFPLMIKAVRGGGGKGMRIAMTEADFLPQLESAKRESLKSFGDDNMLLEQYITDPRHVEVQVFADMHGNAVHLFERDCSVQRRHQKIIEEAPAPGLSEETRRSLGEAAVRAAKAVGYVGAGTVEFILHRQTHEFHFMEMNTRLQVEHPITEMITGTDLVEWQLRVAAGEQLPLSQEQIIRRGHAVETGVREGQEVSVHYDPMIAKLVVWGRDRSEALAKTRAKLSEYQLLTNQQANTVKDNWKGISVQPQSWRPNYELQKTIPLRFDEKDLKVTVKYESAPNSYSVKVNDGEWRQVEASLQTTEKGLRLNTLIGDKKTNVGLLTYDQEVHVYDENGQTVVELPRPKYQASSVDSSAAANSASSPTPGVLERVLVSKGDKVVKGQPLFVVIAMKMEYVVRSPRDGVVAALAPFKLGDSVGKGAQVVMLEGDS
ncbi:hypothetical protein HF086_001307 [Spodoptera exigua]|uniref:Methylcrotonoyl-CoA carboxylase subunit alpha, mitochondrial n=1 Tax=Spodoptera exigua TaxID=7107 RepID=A0A922MBW4_SPOEX|nr:hypothetical protein HF086_001307 [Spodoptera exigua]